MRNAVCLCAFAISVLTVAAPFAQAIVAPLDTPLDFTGEWAGKNWTFSSAPVYRYSETSVVAISADTLLTAGHAAPGVGSSIMLNDVQSYTVTSVTMCPFADLAIAKLSRPTSTWVVPYGGPVNVGDPVEMIGYGYGGDTYVDGTDPSNATPKIKRWGTNSIDSISSLLVMNYHAGDTEYEATYAGGDSGGGTFIKIGDTWKTVGINDAIGFNAQGLTNASYAENVANPSIYQWIIPLTTLPGDANFDNTVSFADYLIMEANFGKSSGADYNTGDFNFDGKVNFADYLILEANFGKSSVPEPSTLCLLGVGLLAAARRKIRIRNRSLIACCAAALCTLMAPAKSLANPYIAVDLEYNTLWKTAGYGISGNAQQVGGQFPWGAGGDWHAFLWSGGNASQYTDLNPSGFTSSWAKGTNGSQQVGYGLGTATGLEDHALLWNGSAAGYVDLNPSGFTSSFGMGIGGNQEIGYGAGDGTGNVDHALLWSGTAGSCLDLNPSGFTASEAYAISGGAQVGRGYGPSTGGTDKWHALLWNGNASAVDLNPDGFTTSQANGVAGSQQVGTGSGTRTGGYDNAVLWNGSAGGYIDLNAPDFTWSGAYATNGTQQVGYGAGAFSGNAAHAILWNGSPTNYVDLQQLLPAGFTSSYAMGIDAYGDVIGYATSSASGRQHAILWQAILPGDANMDGSVSFYDYLVLEQNFGQTGKTWTDGDFNNDGKVNFADYLLLEANFGKSTPEPATLGLLVLGALATLRRK